MTRRIPLLLLRIPHRCRRPCYSSILHPSTCSTRLNGQRDKQVSSHQHSNWEVPHIQTMLSKLLLAIYTALRSLLLIGLSSSHERQDYSDSQFCIVYCTTG